MVDDPWHGAFAFVDGDHQLARVNRVEELRDRCQSGLRGPILVSTSVETDYEQSRSLLLKSQRLRDGRAFHWLVWFLQVDCPESCLL